MILQKKYFQYGNNSAECDTLVPLYHFSVNTQQGLSVNTQQGLPGFKLFKWP